MIRIYDTLNCSFWVVLLLISVWSWGRSFFKKGQPGPVAASLMGLFSLVIAMVGLRLAYVAPLAIIQDFAAARMALKGERLPTTEIKPLVKEILAEEARPASLETAWPWLAAVWPELVSQEQREYDRIATIINEQAHPPFATLFVVPFLYFLHIHGGSLAFSLLALATFGATLPLLSRELRLNLSASQKVFFCAAVLGWYPMFVVLSHGQWGALLGLLVAVGWYCLRHDRPLLAGFAIGIAASMKVFPALLLVYFLVRHRRAFWSGVATIVIVNGATMALLGPQSFIDYLHTTRHVAGQYGYTQQNWCLFSALHRVGELLSIPSLGSRTAFLATAFLLVSALCIVVLSDRSSRPRMDFEYSLFVLAMTFLSPTCWSHYFVVLLLPLAVLGDRALRGSALSSLMFLGLFLSLSLPDFYTHDVLPVLVRQLGERVGLAFHLLPSLALIGMTIWLAKLARDQPRAYEDAEKLA